MSSDSSRRGFLKGLAGASTAGIIGSAGCLRLPPEQGSPRGGPGTSVGGPVAAGEHFYQDGPPERDGPTIIYPSSGHESLQAAYEALSEGGTLRINPGTYTERLSLDQSPSNHVSIIGDGGVTIQQPDGAENYTIGMPTSTAPDYTSQTSLAAPHTSNESQLFVENIPQDWEPGAVIRVKENQPPYHDRSHGKVGDIPTHEMATITQIDRGSNTVELGSPLWLPYPNEYETEVGLVRGFISDVRISNLTIHGDPATNVNYLTPLYLSGLRNLWADTLTVERSANDGMLCRLGHSYQCRFNNIRFNDGDRYALDIVRGSTDTFASNLEATNINRYVMRMGPPTTGDNATPVGGLAKNITASGYGSFACNSHLPSWHVTYENVTADNCPLTRLRTYGHTVNNFTVNSDSATGGTRQIEIEQCADNCRIRGGAADGAADIMVNDGHIFYFNTHNPDVRSYDEYARDITFQNLSIAPYDGRSADDIGLFTDDGADIRGQIVFQDVYYDGQHITAENVRNWDYYNLSTTEDYDIVIQASGSGGGTA